MNIVDLHVHSNKSDGSFTPAELVDYAVTKGLSAFALTDHDTTVGVEEAVTAAGNLPSATPLTVIPGIEFSTKYENKDIHIVGIFIDYKNPEFQKQIQSFLDSRVMRNIKMCDNLKNAGIEISYESLLHAFPDSVITRGHYAKYLKDHGYVKSAPEAFDRYIGDHCKYFVPREKVTPFQAVELILQFGGIPILAHPLLYHLSKTRLDTLVCRLRETGLIGIEAVYSTHSPSEERFVRKLAKNHGLCISGGSDFHGTTKPGLDLATGYGHLVIPDDILTELKKHLPGSQDAKILFTDLDGTLLNSQKSITDFTRNILKHWTKAGNKLVLSSGRAIDSVMDVKKTLRLDFPNMYLIGYNGGEIYNCATGESIFRVALTMEQTKQIMKTAEVMDVHCHTYTDTHIVTRKESEELVYYKRAIHSPVLVSDDIPAALDKPPCKCIAIELHDKEKLENFRKKLEDQLGSQVALLYSNEKYLEIFPSAAGKGAAVEKLCEKLGIPVENSIAAGDEENDISMLTAAGLGIAMKNGRDIVKSNADIITVSDNNNDGLAEALLQYMTL